MYYAELIATSIVINKEQVSPWISNDTIVDEAHRRWCRRFIDQNSSQALFLTLIPLVFTRHHLPYLFTPILLNLCNNHPIFGWCVYVSSGSFELRLKLLYSHFIPTDQSTHGRIEREHKLLRLLNAFIRFLCDVLWCHHWVWYSVYQ